LLGTHVADQGPRPPGDVPQRAVLRADPLAVLLGLRFPLADALLLAGDLPFHALCDRREVVAALLPTRLPPADDDRDDAAHRGDAGDGGGTDRGQHLRSDAVAPFVLGALPTGRHEVD
jgi:hypothetical protein